MIRVGPRLSIVASCLGCTYERSEHYSVQGDSGHNVTCVHPASPLSPNANVGDSTWKTPTWCPLCGAALAELMKANAAVVMVGESTKGVEREARR